jgi:hypothetical protein
MSLQTNPKDQQTIVEDQKLYSTALKQAVEYLRMDVRRYNYNFVLTDSINMDNITFEQVATDAFGSAVYRVLYDVYISEEENGKVQVPLTWFDHLKSDLIKKFPKLSKIMKVSYRDIITITRTFYPEVKVESNQILMYKYTPKYLPMTYFTDEPSSQRDDEKSVDVPY